MRDAGQKLEQAGYGGIVENRPLRRRRALHDSEVIQNGNQRVDLLLVITELAIA